MYLKTCRRTELNPSYAIFLDNKKFVYKKIIAANIYLSKVNSRSTRKSCEIYSLTIKTVEWHQWLKNLLEISYRETNPWIPIKNFVIWVKMQKEKEVKCIFDENLLFQSQKICNLLHRLIYLFDICESSHKKTNVINIS